MASGSRLRRAHQANTGSVISESAISGRSRRKMFQGRGPKTGEVERGGAAGHPVRREPGVVPGARAVPIHQVDPAEVEPDGERHAGAGEDDVTDDVAA